MPVMDSISLKQMAKNALNSAISTHTNATIKEHLLTLMLSSSSET